MTVREHRKLWKNPLVFAAVLVGVMVNVFLLWYSEDSRNPYMDVSVSAYRSVYKQIEGMDTESAKAYVQGIIGEGDEEEDSSQEDEMPIEQENAFKLAAAEIANTGSYDVYLESKEEEAEARREFAIFQSADSDDYAAADTEQTLSVLRKFQGRYLEAGASRGVHMVLEFVQTDIVGLVVLLLGLSLAFMREKELGEHDFIRTMPEGRWHLMTAKYLSLCLFATETAVLMFGSSVVTAYRMYGFGGTHRYLQSVSGYIASGFSGNVGQALLAALAGKILNYILVITVLLTVMVFCRRAMEVYVCVGIWLGVSALLYYGISENSAYSNWKNINIIAYLQIGRMLKLYRNINLFGTPVSYLTVYLVTACAGIVVLAVVTTLGFGAQKIPMRSAWKLRMRRISLYKWSSLGCMEGRKILLHQQTLLFLLAAATAAWFLYTPVASIYWDQDDIYYKQYMDQLSGPYTDAKEQQICKWEKEMETYEQEREAALENATTDLMASLITDKYDDLMKPENALQKVRSHADYIKSVPNSAFFYPRGYEQLTGGENAGNGDALHALAAVLLVILCMTGVYGMEYATGMRRLLYCSTEGRGKLHAWKWGISVLIVTVIYALVYVPWFYQIFSAFGSDGIQASVASMEHISKIYAGFSVGEYLCLISVGRYLGLLAVMACIFWLSRMTKSYMLTIAIATAFVVLPLLLELSGIGGMQYILLNPLLLGNI